MKVGDLVRYQEKYWHGGRVIDNIGLVLTVEDPECAPCPIRVHWVNHKSTERDWYAEEELTRISLTRGSK